MLSALVLPLAVVVAAPPNADVEKKIDALIAAMTIEEKAGQLTQLEGGRERLRERVRAGGVGSVLNVVGADEVNALQRAAIEKTRLHIPLLFGFDVIHGYRTVFPVPLASAASFDPELIEASERVAAREASAAGVKWTFAPMVDIARDPRWGRIVEGAGEDPYLGGVVAAARVRGFQGADAGDPTRVVACLKHYVGYGAAEGGRDYNTAEISIPTLREIYLPPFRAGVEAGAWTVMSAFEDLDGTPASANRFTLTDVLRGEWKFPGFVVSDWGAVKELMIHGVAKDGAHAASLAITAGVDLDMVDDLYADELPKLVKSGRVPMAVVDEAVRRILRVKMAAGVFEHPYASPERAADLVAPEHRAAARAMARESMVLLKNDDDLLPLAKSTKTVALIGPLGDDKVNQLGPWSASGDFNDVITPLAGLRAAAPSVRIVTAFGAALGDDDTSKIADAVDVAKRADVAVLVLGEPAGDSGEASSRSTLALPGAQQALLEAVAATKTPVILVVESGRPVDLSWASAHVQAILAAFFPGTEAGNALADVIFGDASPSARLPFSWPRSAGQIPVYYNHKNTGRPSSPDRWHTGYQHESQDPLYPFGFGLTYGKIEYTNVKVKTPVVDEHGALVVTVDVKNAGKRAAVEVVQLYVHPRTAPLSPPVRALKAFARQALRPGEKKTVELRVDAKDLAVGPVPTGTWDVWVARDAVSGSPATFAVQGDKAKSTPR